MTNKELIKKIEKLEQEIQKLKSEKQQIIIQPGYPYYPTIPQPYIIPQYPTYENPCKWEITCSSIKLNQEKQR